MRCTTTLALVTACPSESTRPLIDPSLLRLAGVWASAGIEQAQTHAANSVALKSWTRRRLPSIMTLTQGDFGFAVRVNVSVISVTTPLLVATICRADTRPVCR